MVNVIIPYVLTVEQITFHLFAMGINVTQIPNVYQEHVIIIFVKHALRKIVLMTAIVIFATGIHALQIKTVLHIIVLI
jgi:hypothetical protein